MEVLVGMCIIIALCIALSSGKLDPPKRRPRYYKDKAGRIHRMPRRSGGAGLRQPRLRRPAHAPRHQHGASGAKTVHLEQTPWAAKNAAIVLRGKAFVTDGDSLWVQKNEIRLFGVDAPEMKHPFGNQAKLALIKLCKGQEIRAEVDHVDAHGRTVAKCYLPDGRDLSAEMVKLGLAIDWPKFSGGKYKDLEVADARNKMWLADARQKGRMHVWAQYEARKAKS